MLVLDGDERGERFGLVVDRVGGVVSVERGSHTGNPATLDAPGQWLFDGAFRTPEGLLVRVDPEQLKPARIAASGLFEHVRRAA